MAMLIGASIDVMKVPKEKLQDYDRKDGSKAKFLNLTFSVNDEVDQFGNNCSIWINQTQEERESKADRIYLGNGKIVWSGSYNTPQQQGGFNSAPQQQGGFNSAPQQDDDLPF